MAACDRGMTIRQDVPNEGREANTSVAIHVRAINPLIGETWYPPEIEITNLSGSPITVTTVELVAQPATLQNKPRRSGTYPLEIPPRQTETLDI